MATAAGKRHMARVAGLCCVLCRFLSLADDTPAVVHHVMAGRGGWGKSSDFRTIPLCPEHHVGATGVHGLGSKVFPVVHGVTEDELLQLTNEALGVA
jgi:hypothetical protein